MSYCTTKIFKKIKRKSWTLHKNSSQYTVGEERRITRLVSLEIITFGQRQPICNIIGFPKNMFYLHLSAVTNPIVPSLNHSPIWMHLTTTMQHKINIQPTNDECHWLNQPLKQGLDSKNYAIKRFDVPWFLYVSFF